MRYWRTYVLNNPWNKSTFNQHWLLAIHITSYITLLDVYIIKIEKKLHNYILLKILCIENTNNSLLIKKRIIREVSEFWQFSKGQITQYTYFGLLL